MICLFLRASNQMRDVLISFSKTFTYLQAIFVILKDFPYMKIELLKRDFENALIFFLKFILLCYFCNTLSRNLNSECKIIHRKYFFSMDVFFCAKFLPNDVISPYTKKQSSEISQVFSSSLE